MIFGDKTDFAIEAHHELFSETDTHAFDRCVVGVREVC